MLREGVPEVTFYGFTKDNNKRATDQREAFTQACLDAVTLLSQKDATLFIVGNTHSKAFPPELLPFANQRISFGRGGIHVNFLVNYDWEWDMKMIQETGSIASAEIPRVDLIIRWGGRQRLSGFLPVQSVYADFYTLDALWPDFCDQHFHDAMDWFQSCDVTLGG